MENEKDFSVFLKQQLALREKINQGEATWQDMADLQNNFGLSKITKDSIRRSFKKLDEYIENGWVSAPTKMPQKEVVEFNYEKNTTTSDKIIALNSKDINNPKALLKAHGFDEKVFQLVSAKSSMWQQGTRQGEKTLYSSKISVKPKQSLDISFEDIDEYFSKKHFYNGISISENHTYDNEDSEEFLEICLQDLHIGLLSYENETGEKYNIELAKQRLESAIADILDRSQGKKFKRVVFAMLGDILHVDNQQNTTTKGTRQDTDGKINAMFDCALELIINVIKTLTKIAPVEVINVVGNHDSTINYMLSRSIEMAYKNDLNVTFYNSPNPRKWKRYGKVLIGWTHGDIKSKNVSDWLQCEAYEDWGKSAFRECHMGHLHSTSTLQKIEESGSGLIIRYLPTLCASSAWEHHQGYGKIPKTLMSFVWNENKGLRDIWYSNI